MNIFLAKITLVLIVLNIHVNANIQLIKKENSDSNTTLLVIGGIHGDEPGGYFSASILSTHYKINSKNLWVVPNLNKYSIQQGSRGLNGDMNRKFSSLSKNDKDKDTIDEIKKIILEDKVSLVLNLHDGHGFYRTENHNKIFNPNAWGQTCVIDQCKLNANQPFGNLNNIALEIKARMNKKLLKDHHSFNVRNTNTKFDDEAMQLSLTYFAVTNNKPAFAIESSKNLSTLSQKVFYQLMAIEEFMNIMDISFSREFELNEKSINTIINDYATLNINGNISLDLTDIKSYLSFIPLRLKDNLFEFSNPLGTFSYENGFFNAYIGNKRVVALKPQYFKISQECQERFDVIIDGNITSLNKTSDIVVNDDFNVVENGDFRVNVIGYSPNNQQSESGVDISLKELNERYSLDRDGKVYRVEFYKDDDFCFMSKVRFK